MSSSKNRTGNIDQMVLGKLIGNEKLMQQVFNALPQGIFVTDSEGKCSYANASCVRQLDFTGKSELIGKNLSRLIGQNESVDTLGSTNANKKGQDFADVNPQTVDHRWLVRSDGSKFLAECRSFPITGKGIPAGNLVVFVPIDDYAKRLTLSELARFPEMNPGPVLQLDLNGNVIMSNAAAKDIFGLKLQKYCWQDICPAIDNKAWDSIINAQRPVSIERMIGNATFIFNHHCDLNNGQVFVYGADVTEKKKAEKALRESDELVRLLLNSTVEGIYGIDLAGNCTFANEACVRLLDFDNVEELQGKQMHALVHRIDSNGEKCQYVESRIYKALLREESAYVNDEVMFRRDNSSFPVEYWSHPVKQEGEVIGCVVTFMDATRRRQTEQLQSDYTSALAEIARFPEMNPGPVLRLDTDGKVLMANKAAHNVFKKPVNHFWQDICPEIDDKTWKRIIKMKTVVLERQIGKRDYLFTHRRDFEGNSVFVFGANITEQKQVEWALQQNEKMASLGKLSAGLAHELNNPAAAAGRAGDQLSGILDALQTAIIDLTKCNIDHELWILFSSRINEFRRRKAHEYTLTPLEIGDREEELQQWLEAHGTGDTGEMASTMVKFCMEPNDLEKIASMISPDILSVAMKWLYRVLTAYELTDSIVNSTQNISNLVNLVKSYSHMGSAPEKFVDIHKGIDDTIAILRHHMKDRIEIIREYDRDLPQIRIEGSELNQVWTNVIDNAVDAINSNGKIVIKTFRKNGWIIVQIKDTGPGIPKEIQPKIFDPFFTTKPPGDGTGLGLNITHNIIVQQHRGRISVNSVPGDTCFEIKLPIKLKQSIHS